MSCHANSKQHLEFKPNSNSKAHTPLHKLYHSAITTHVGGSYYQKHLLPVAGATAPVFCGHKVTEVVVTLTSLGFVCWVSNRNKNMYDFIHNSKH